MKLFFALLMAAALGPWLAIGIFGWGAFTYWRHEREIVERMDQYWLTVTSPGREEYLLEEDETFEVPYMASKLSVAAVPTRILDAEGRLIGEYSVERGVYVADPEELPVFLRRALVATEDGTFYEHPGYNWRAIARATLYNLRHLRFAQGGSTITQQLAKMMFTTRRKTLGRKAYELFCARKIERKFTKDQILLMYFNFAYFGHGAFGVESAARFYFGKSARELELPEAALLVGVIASPNKYSPFEDLALARARHRTVLGRMAKLGFIPSGSAQRISDEFWERYAKRLRAPEVSFWRMRVNEAPYLVEFVRRQLLQRFSKERLLKGGLRIHTTFDLPVQQAAEAALKGALAEENAPGRPPIEGALAAVRPEDGAMLALVGGSGFNFGNQLVRAVDSRRPIGSTVKPFVFAAAFESGRFKPEDRIVDEPLRFRFGGKSWEPANYGGRYYGEVTLALALQKSLNSVAIRLLEAVGVDQAIRVLSRASGLPPESFPRDLTLALGTMDMSALELARAFSALVNDGRSAEPYFLRRVEDRDGRVLVDPGPRPAAAAALKPETCRALVELLRGVFGPEGTAHAAARRTGFNIPAAGKTGTTSDYRDAWFAGVVPGLSAAVWMGHDDMRVALGEGKAGGAIAAPAWMSFIKAVYRDRPTRDFAAPQKK